MKRIQWVVVLMSHWPKEHDWSLISWLKITAQNVYDNHHRCKQQGTTYCQGEEEEFWVNMYITVRRDRHERLKKTRWKRSGRSSGMFNSCIHVWPHFRYSFVWKSSFNRSHPSLPQLSSSVAIGGEIWWVAAYLRYVFYLKLSAKVPIRYKTCQQLICPCFGCSSRTRGPYSQSSFVAS